MTNFARPFSVAHPCRCPDCACRVEVHSLHDVCRACSKGGHDLLSWKKHRPRMQAGSRRDAA